MSALSSSSRQLWVPRCIRKSRHHRPFAAWRLDIPVAEEQSVEAKQYYNGAMKVVNDQPPRCLEPVASVLQYRYNNRASHRLNDMCSASRLVEQEMKDRLVELDNESGGKDRRTERITRSIATALRAAIADSNTDLGLLNRAPRARATIQSDAGAASRFAQQELCDRNLQAYHVHSKNLRTSKNHK